MRKQRKQASVPWLHNGDAWGELKAERGQLFSVPDLVYWHTMAGDRLPLQPAAEKVFNALAAAPSVALFVTRPSTWAFEATDESPMCRAAAAARRGKPAVAELKGRRGLLVLIREAWRSRLLSYSDLYVMLGNGQLAVLQDDAAALFPDVLRELFPDWLGDGENEIKAGESVNAAGAEKPAPVAAPRAVPVPALPAGAAGLRLAAGGLASVAAAVVELKPAKRPGERWTVEHRAALIAQHKSLTDGPQRMKVEVADRDIAEAWGVGESCIKQQRLAGQGEARAESPAHVGKRHQIAR